MNIRNSEPAEQNAKFFRTWIKIQEQNFLVFKRNNRITVQRPFFIKMLGMIIPTVHGLEVIFCVK